MSAFSSLDPGSLASQWDTLGSRPYDSKGYKKCPIKGLGANVLVALASVLMALLTTVFPASIFKQPWSPCIHYGCSWMPHQLVWWLMIPPIVLISYISPIADKITSDPGTCEPLGPVPLSSHWPASSLTTSEMLKSRFSGSYELNFFLPQSYVENLKPKMSI